MACVGCGPSRFSIEHTRRYKPESHAGCSCGGKDNKCDTPSNAVEGSPLWYWEQKHGKLVTTVTFVQNEWGRTVQVVEKKPCPPTDPEPKRQGCCSLRYKVPR